MIDIHKKLLTVVPVDQQVVSSLLLGGIVNILNKHEVIDALEDEVESLKIDNQTNKARIESIENWLLKQDENLKELKTELSTTSDNRNNDTSREFENPPKEVANLGNKKAFEKKCNQCGKIFYRNSDFEKHMEEKHEAEKTFECNTCGKKFLLEC